MQQIFDALAAADYVLKINVMRVADVEDLLDKLMTVNKRRSQEERQILLDLPLNETEYVLRTVVSTEFLLLHFTEHKHAKEIY